MYLPDTLSRTPLSNSDCAAAELTVEADAYLDVFLVDLPATPGKLEEIKNAQKADPDCRLIATFAREGWPAQNTLRRRNNGSERTVAEGITNHRSCNLTSRNLGKDPHRPLGHCQMSGKSSRVGMVAWVGRRDQIPRRKLRRLQVRKAKSG